MNAAWFNLQEISKVGKPPETENRITVARGYGKEKWRVAILWFKNFIYTRWISFGYQLQTYIVPVFNNICFPGPLVVKNLPACARDIWDAGSVFGSGWSSGGGHGNPLQYFCLENPMDRGVWRAMVHWVVKSQTQLKQLSSFWSPWYFPTFLGLFLVLWPESWHFIYSILPQTSHVCPCSWG